MTITDAIHFIFGMALSIMVVLGPVIYVVLKMKYERRQGDE